VKCWGVLFAEACTVHTNNVQDPLQRAFRDGSRQRIMAVATVQKRKLSQHRGSTPGGTIIIVVVAGRKRHCKKYTRRRMRLSSFDARFVIDCKSRECISLARILIFIIARFRAIDPPAV
jgi:hypothetical protein